MWTTKRSSPNIDQLTPKGTGPRGEENERTVHPKSICHLCNVMKIIFERNDADGSFWFMRPNSFTHTPYQGTSQPASQPTGAGLWTLTDTTLVRDFQDQCCFVATESDMS